MIQSRNIWCAAGSHGSTHFKNTGIIKGKKSVFRAAHKRCVDAFLSDHDRDLQDAAIHDSARFWKLINAR